MTPLAEQLKAVIECQGPLTVEAFVMACLYHPTYGYYSTQRPIGGDGDYITAPEMTQVFGELIGLWVFQQWERLNKPSQIYLVELGPGNGTLMADLVRMAQNWPDFSNSLNIHFVEWSPILKQRQQDKVPTATWHQDTQTLPQGPTIFIANEFFDALPHQQHYQTDSGQWLERLVLWQDSGFSFDAEAHTIRESSPLGQLYAQTLANHLRHHGGAALIIDYGYIEGSGDTLQALRHHRYESPLATPGEIDLTFHVDFQALSQAFMAAGLATHKITTMGQFLESYGIEARTQQLCQKATPSQQDQLMTAAVRLTSPSHMGTLFKVLEVEA